MGSNVCKLRQRTFSASPHTISETELIDSPFIIEYFQQIIYYLINKRPIKNQYIRHLFQRYFFAASAVCNFFVLTLALISCKTYPDITCIKTWIK